MATTTRVRLADFLLNPEIDDSRLELMDGEVTEKPMPDWDHAEIALELGAILKQFGRAGVEPRAVIESAGASPIPDVAFYRSGRPKRRDYMRTPPHVAVEILSSGQTLAFMRRKAALYLSFGVESVWIVDLERMEILILEGETERTYMRGQQLITSSVPGLSLDITELFDMGDRDEG